MYHPPEKPKVLAFFGKTGDAAKLHQGEDFSTRLEEEIRIHQGQIQAENLLLNSVAKFQHIARAHDVPREEFNQLLRDNKYSLEATKAAMMQRYGITEAEFSQPVDFEPVDTADYMRQRASMMGAVLASTPVLLRDPWEGKPATAQYGFTDFKAEVDGVGFSAIATPRFKGIPFRFAVMKHDHDGYTDNNPAMIMSGEFCDAFEQYNKDKGGNVPADKHPLIDAMATSLKPNIHDRFHNWLLYDIHAASDVFKQWGNDIFFVEHADKNPLLINYEQVALSFHLYSWQTMFEKNPGMGKPALPGGFIDPTKGGGTESAVQAAAREALEEVDVTLENGTPVGKRNMNRPFDVRVASKALPQYGIAEGDVFMVSTQAVRFDVPDLKKTELKAGDDAEPGSARRVALSSLTKEQMGVGDHFDMIREAVPEAFAQVGGDSWVGTLGPRTGRKLG